VRPRNNCKVTKSPSAVLTWVPTLGAIPLPREGLLTWTYLLTCILGISKRISALKHISTSILVTMTSKTPNQETKVPSPSTRDGTGSPGHGSPGQQFGSGSGRVTGQSPDPAFWPGFLFSVVKNCRQSVSFIIIMRYRGHCHVSHKQVAETSV